MTTQRLCMPLARRQLLSTGASVALAPWLLHCAPSGSLPSSPASASGGAGSIGGVGYANSNGGLSGSGSSGNSSSGSTLATDFGFLTGEWKIANRRLTDAAKQTWDEFAGEATVFAALDGAASIEWLRIPSRGFAGMGIRLFRPETGLWADHWVNAKSGVLGEPMLGSFANGVATFLADEVDDGVPIKARGVWDQITATSCRWFQSVSRDGGKTWSDNWVMHWTRA